MTSPSLTSSDSFLFLCALFLSAFFLPLPLPPAASLFSQIRKGAPLHDEWRDAFTSGRFHQRQGRAALKLPYESDALASGQRHNGSGSSHGSNASGSSSGESNSSNGNGRGGGGGGGSGVGIGSEHAQEASTAAAPKTKKSGRRNTTNPASKPSKTNSGNSSANAYSCGASFSSKRNRFEHETVSGGPTAAYAYAYGAHREGDDEGEETNDEDSKIDPAFALMLLGGHSAPPQSRSLKKATAAAVAAAAAGVAGKTSAADHKNSHERSGKGGTRDDDDGMPQEASANPHEGALELSDHSQMELRSFFLALSR